MWNVYISYIVIAQIGIALCMASFFIILIITGCFQPLYDSCSD